MFHHHLFSGEREPRGREHFHERCGHRGRHGGFGGMWGRGERDRGERGGSRERMFDGGDLRLLILQLLAEKPSYGYELIKTMEGRLSGGYAPSPGVIYPTLTMLEEEGLATAATEGGKKVFTLTDAGHAALAEHKERIDSINERLSAAGKVFERGRSPQIMRAFMNLRGAIKARAGRGRMTEEQVAKVAAIIEAAAKAIDEI